MSHIPEHLKFAPNHEWVQLESGNVVRVGISDFAQAELGDIMYVTLPELGRVLNANEQCATIESVKTASDLFSPVSGTVVQINNAVVDEPEQINDDPYETWLFAIKAENLDELDQLMDAEAYRQMIEQ